MNTDQQIKYILREHLNERYIADLIVNFGISYLNEKLLKDLKSLKKDQRNYVEAHEGRALNIYQHSGEKYRLDKPIFIKIKILNKTQFTELLKEEGVHVTDYQITHHKGHLRNGFYTNMTATFEYREKVFNATYSTGCQIKNN